jgi:hypothetical protein
MPSASRVNPGIRPRRIAKAGIPAPRPLASVVGKKRKCSPRRPRCRPLKRTHATRVIVKLEVREVVKRMAEE